MKSVSPLIFASVLVLAGSTTWAEDAHHPETAAPAAKAQKVAPGSAVAKESMKKMDTQMMNMCEMHEKMMNAKTPEERNALMAEHMKAMQEGMAMMGGMAGAGRNSIKGGMPSDMAAHQQMMEKRMEMMEMMMQMMMDRLPPAASR